MVAIVASGGARLQEPTIEPWLDGEGTAIHSPPLGAALRRRRHARQREAVG